jgi:hypothetical protein
LYLPWPGFQGFDTETPEPSAEALELAARFHPAWGRCSSAARSLHARNGHQVLGAELDSPVSFVACWTPDGSLDGGARSAGGTGQALRIAAGFEVPVVNLARADHRSGVEALLGSERGSGMSLLDSIEVVSSEERDLPPTDEQMSQLYMFVQLRGTGGFCTPATRGEAEEELRRLWAL